jgi:hypothetical protein
VCRLLPLAVQRLLGICFVQEKDPNKLIHIDLDDIKRSSVLFIEGYFQSYKYFTNNKTAIFRPESLFARFSLAPLYNAYFNAIMESSAVSVHVRRVQYNHELSMTYYDEAITMLRTKVAIPKFFIFSDNLDWCREHFTGSDICFVAVTVPDEIQELYLMTQCKHHIIANSSFSWWGAWLSPNDEKVVVAPKATQIGVPNEFYPSEWLTI